MLTPEQLAALTAAGFAVVPVEPTEEMIMRAQHLLEVPVGATDLACLWKEMLRAASAAVSR